MIPTRENVVPVSVFSMAGRYLKGALTKLGCSTCHGRGVRTCSKCHGRGILLGEGIVSGETPASFLEPCRRCIGRGKEECQECAQAAQLRAMAVGSH